MAREGALMIEKMLAIGIDLEVAELQQIAFPSRLPAWKIESKDWPSIPVRGGLLSFLPNRAKCDGVSCLLGGGGHVSPIPS